MLITDTLLNYKAFNVIILMLVIIMIITRLVHAICGEYQSEMKLISRLNNYFNFDHHIFLLDPSVDVDCFVNKTDFTPRTLLYLESVDEEANLTIGSKNTFMVVVPPATTEFNNNFTILHQMKSIQRLQVNLKIGIFFLQFISIENLRTLFEWCRQELIVNIFAAISVNVSYSNSLNVFAFHPFIALDVMNVTEYTNGSVFPSLDFNFHRHRLRLSNTMKTTIALNFWDIVLSQMNASSFKVVNNWTFMDMLGIDFEVAPDLYGQVLPHYLNVYTLEMTQEVLLVPEALSYSDFSTYLLAIMSDAFFGYFLILVAVIILLLVIIRYVNQKECILFESVADVVNLLMNDNGAIKYSQLARSEMYLIVPLTFVGLVAVNGILSILQSYVTRPISQPQIKTAYEIYDSKLPILTWHDEWKEDVISVLKNQTKFEDWDDKVLAVDMKTFLQLRGRYNRSAAYLSNVKNANIFIQVQRMLDMKGFYNTGIVISNSMYSYRVGETFIFIDRLNEIIHRIQTSGLYAFWERRGNHIFARALLKQQLRRLQELVRSETAIDFPFFIVYGWLCSVIVLALEIIWEKLQLWRMKKLLKERNW